MRTKQRQQRGATAVETGILSLLFFVFLLLAIEVARAMFVWNAVQESTRRAARQAAVTDFGNSAALAALRSAAMLSDTGKLPLAPEIDSSSLRIEYLSLSSAGTLTPVNTLPGCPTENKRNCTADPNGAACIRFVRASFCKPGSSPCAALDYVPLFGLTNLWPGPALTVPPASTTLPAQSLGSTPGSNACP